MVNQAEELVNMYYDSIGLKTVLPGFKKNSIDAVNQLLNNGVEYGKIIKAIEYYVECSDTFSERPYINLNSVFNLEEVRSILKLDINECDNLINKTAFYFHRKLRIAPKAPVLSIDQYGEKKTEVQPFFLEMVTHFSSEDLLEYFYELHGIDKFYRKEKRDLAGVKYIIEQYRESPLQVNWLDLILYMVDVSRQIIIDEDRRPLTNILKIQDYEQEAFDLLTDKMNYEKVNGVDHVVSRKQVDSGNGWSK